MKYVIVDDEIRALNLLKIMLQRCDKVLPSDEIHTFSNAEDALSYLLTNPADILFLDIEMPVLNGVDFAHRLTGQLSNPPEIIFITAFPQYALEAWDIGAAGYVLKPYSTDQLYTVLQRTLKHLSADTSVLDLPRIQCFSDFDVLVKGQSLLFKSRKAKELLALLVHYRGSWVDIEKIAFCLLEDCEVNSSKNYCRTLLYRLKQTLSKADIQDIVESEYGQLRVNPDKFTCDYYEYLNGKTELFRGSYLEEYSWAETTQAAMWHHMINRQGDAL